ncbi:synapse differentiation-inducing protein 1-like [Crotalus adamanteus]|uniref:Synapse differentiation-inducing protein 1-like n=1 Tax=Crotalus adamanteus TaxID=8729 RepID=A0AAW1AYH3_CROAD
MSKPQYKKMEEDVPEVQNPPPYVENQPAPSGFLGPPQYQPPYDPRYNQGLVIQPTQTMNFVRLQPIKEPDYMAYSIFTMLCCCLPLGIAALIYSIQTQEANRTGNAESARRNSKLSRNLSHAALGVGLGSLTLYIIFVVFMYTQRASLLIDNPYTISP